MKAHFDGGGMSGDAKPRKGDAMAKRISITRRGALAGGLAFGAMSPAAGAAERGQRDLALWYRQPAAAWTEALPVGNGRLGAMVFGRVAQERLQLNEDTLWAGSPYIADNPDSAAALHEIAALLQAGQYEEAERLGSSKAMGTPLTQMSTLR